MRFSVGSAPELKLSVTARFLSDEELGLKMNGLRLSPCKHKMPLWQSG